MNIFILPSLMETLVLIISSMMSIICIIYMIANMGWIGLCPKLLGLDWVGLRKLDPCPTLSGT